MVREVREGEARIPAQGVETREEDWALAVGFEEREEGRRKGDEENEVSLSLARARSLSLSVAVSLSLPLPPSLSRAEERGQGDGPAAVGYGESAHVFVQGRLVGETFGAQWEGVFGVQVLRFRV